jgi:hypothetical protein
MADALLAKLQGRANPAAVSATPALELSSPPLTNATLTNVPLNEPEVPFTIPPATTPERKASIAGGDTLTNAQADHLAGLLEQSEISELALRSVAFRDRMVKLTITLAALACAFSTFIISGFDTGIEPKAGEQATIVLSAASGVLLVLLERLPAVKRAIKYAELAADWRGLCRGLEEAVHYSVPKTYSDAQTCVDALSRVYTELGVKTPVLPDSHLTTARDRQQRNASSRAPRRQSVTSNGRIRGLSRHGLEIC